ncbi:MAG: type II toxin-antitoxin system VapC family toxin [Puniceicoccaceae bacterium]
MILDTNAVSDWWRGTPALVRLLRRTDAIHLPAPVLAEYRFGILKSRHQEKMEIWFEEAKRSATLLPVDAQTADCYASLRLALEMKGKKIPMNDLWIAAIARQHKLPILSLDTHFDLITGLERLTW